MVKTFRIMIRLMMIVAVLFTTLFVNAVNNSQNPVLIEINGEKITKSEFIRVYEKNHKHHSTLDPKTMEEYLDLYINFRLKVREAKSLGLDTAESFIKELDKYRRQLAEPYLTDTKVTEKLINEAYERMKYDISASHIMITLQGHTSAEDTLKAYNKIMEIRNKILQGEDFGEIAQKYSEDPSARDRIAPNNQTVIKGNNGYLGYFSAFNMVYPFESAAYNTTPGEISMPVRTQFGYHIIKVHDKTPALGEVRVAHIMIQTTSDDSEEKKLKAEKRIHEIYQKVVDGQPFDQVAMKHSEHRQSAPRGGVLTMTHSNRLLPEFVIALNQINEPGNFSQPIKTQYGWHVIKLLEKHPIKAYDEMYHELKKRIHTDQRSRLSQESFVKKLKNEYEFKANNNAAKLFYDIIDNSIFEKAWDIPDQYELDKTLLEFADKSYNQRDFAEFLYESQSKRTPQPMDVFVNDMLEKFASKRLIEYENSRLEEKYPDFNELLNEYHDGILLFELTDKVVWSKAMKDTAGLKKFYDNNIDDYLGDKRVDATIYTCSTRRVARRVQRQLNRSEENYDLHLQILANNNTGKVVADKNIFEISEKEYLKKIPLEKGISDYISNNDKVIIVHIHEVLQPQPKPLNEIRGMVIADYQNYLENNWINKLREKYNVELDEDVWLEIVNK